MWGQFWKADKKILRYRDDEKASVRVGVLWEGKGGKEKSKWKGEIGE